jgi:hypothetical protein
VRILDSTPLVHDVEHGYPTLNRPALSQLQDHDWSDTRQFYVGLHENCEVTTGAALRVSSRPTGRIVDDVDAAAFKFNGTVQYNERNLEIGRPMLTAECQAEVLTVWEISQKYKSREGSNGLVLTALSGSLFGKPGTLIIEAVGVLRVLQ